MESALLFRARHCAPVAQESRKNVEGDDEPEHLENASRDEAVRLGTLATTGETKQMTALPWRAGCADVEAPPPCHHPGTDVTL